MANQVPKYIKFQSYHPGFQRFWPVEQMKFETLWFPVIEDWVDQNFPERELLYFVMVNLLVINLVYQDPSIPIYMTNLDKKGNSNFSEQQKVLLKVLNLLSNYRKLIWGDR